MAVTIKMPDDVLKLDNKTDYRIDEDKENNMSTPEKTNGKIMEHVEFDELLPYAGEFGIYQIYLFIISLPFYMYGAFVYFVQLFMTEVPSGHWCWIPELANLTVVERRALAIPLDENSRYGYSQCTSYVANWTEVMNTGMKPDATWKISPCGNGWEFNITEIPYPTVGTDFEWVCEKDSYQATAQSIFFAGSVLGGFIIGWIADRYGRLPATVISCLIGSIGGIASVFTTNLAEFALTRFIMGISYDNCMMMMYILLIEYIAPKYRTIAANLSFAFFYALGVCLLPWIALACGHWKILCVVVSVYLALAIFTPFLVPESPTWLLSKGRMEEAINKVLSMGRINKKEIPPKVIDNFRLSFISTNNNIIETTSKFELITRPIIRKLLLLVCFEYLCCCIIFDVISRSVGQFGLNIFISFTAVSITEFPSLVLAAFVMDWMGRRWMGAVFLIICCMATVLIFFAPHGLPSVICAVVARFAVNIACNVTIQWAAEMLPTEVRASGASVVHICGYIGTIISPYIVYLETMAHWLPLAVTSVLALTGAIIALILPETARKNLPQTFVEAECLEKSKKFWEIPCLKSETAEQGVGCSN